MVSNTDLTVYPFFLALQGETEESACETGPIIEKAGSVHIKILAEPGAKYTSILGMQLTLYWMAKFYTSKFKLFVDDKINVC